MGLAPPRIFRRLGYPGSIDGEKITSGGPHHLQSPTPTIPSPAIVLISKGRTERTLSRAGTLRNAQFDGAIVELSPHHARDAPNRSSKLRDTGPCGEEGATPSLQRSDHRASRQCPLSEVTQCRFLGFRTAVVFFCRRVLIQGLELPDQGEGA